MLSSALKRGGFSAGYYADVIPFSPVKADGAHLLDQDGRRILDMNSAYGAARWGHNPTAVVDAVNQQMKQMTLPSRAFENLIEGYSEQVHNVYHNILKRSPNELIQTGYKLGGGDAIDFSIKLAMRYGHEVLGIEDGEQVIVFAGGDDLFNGRILSALPPSRLTQKNEMTLGFGQLMHPNKRLIQFNDLEALHDLFNHPMVRPRISAVLVEPILGEVGYSLQHPNF